MHVRAAARSARLARFSALLVAAIASLAQAQISDIRPSSLPNATVNQGYSVHFTPVKPFQRLPVLWSITPGCLDGSGLSFTPQNGIADSAHISGTPPRTGSFLCTVTARDAGGNVASRRYALSVENPSCNSPRITSTPPTGRIDPGAPFLYAVTVAGPPPHKFSALGLPPGISIDAATGVISGATQADGTYSITVMVRGCGRIVLQSFKLVVGLAPVNLEMASAPNPAVFGQDVAVSVHAAGGAQPPTGTVLLCTTAAGQFCAPPAGTPPPGTPPDHVVAFASAPLDANGSASFTLRGLGIQNYTLQAYYGGDSNYAAARSVPVDQFVIKGVVLPPPTARAGQAPTAGDPAPIPALSPPLLVALAIAIVLAAWRRVPRRR